MQSLSLINQFFSDLSYSQSSLKAQTSLKSDVSDLAAESSRRPLSAGVTVELNYSKTEFSYSGQSEGQSFSVQMMETRLSGQLQSFSKLSEPPGIFRSSGPSPSPENVANRVLGFVVERIDREARAGASEQQLRDLFADGLAGVNQGYGEAIEEIDQRGLLSDELSAEIDAGYSLIESGLEKLREKYLGDSGVTSNESVDKVAARDQTINTNAKANGFVADKGVAEKDANDNENGRKAVVDKVDKQGSGGEIAAKTVANDKDRGPVATERAVREKTDIVIPELPRRARLAEALAFDRSRYAVNDVGINVTTRDGDQVRISVGQLSADNKSLGYSGQSGVQSLAYSQSSLQLDELNLQIEGELDDGELKALESLLLQVEDIATSFFDGDLEKAFAAALEMDVDMTEIASYAVAMNSLRYQAVETAYQQPQTEVEAFKPLTGLVPLFASALAEAAEFSQPRQLVNDLFDKVLQPIEPAPNPSLDLFNGFRNSVIDKLIY